MWFVLLYARKKPFICTFRTWPLIVDTSRLLCLLGTLKRWGSNGGGAVPHGQEIGPSKTSYERRSETFIRESNSWKWRSRRYRNTWCVAGGHVMLAGGHVMRGEGSREVTWYVRRGHVASTDWFLHSIANKLCGSLLVARESVACDLDDLSENWTIWVTW